MATKKKAKKKSAKKKSTNTPRRPKENVTPINNSQSESNQGVGAGQIEDADGEF